MRVSKGRGAEPSTVTPPASVELAPSLDPGGRTSVRDESRPNTETTSPTML